MDGVGEGLDDTAQELGSGHLAHVVTKLDVGELRDTIDGEEHVEFAVGQSKFTDIDVDIADGCIGELTALCAFVGILWQPRDAMPPEAAMQARSCELWDGVAQASEHIVERQQRPTTEFDDHGLLGWRQYRAVGRAW